ncbi:IS3 family transposase [Amycolatopsis acidiphila]|uniref:IS3 family transposase n=1 Tax=Amycolatopsis acidiphila TaxID=715473 RepID=UPI001643DE20|nr:IS3 family transposase [Amycolatopsis acidiphila]UIJ61186.1 IS3 family transposase [Amycolatopsis acidiphila]
MAQAAKQPSARRLADERLLAEIVEIHTCSGGTYGAPRVHAMLRRRYPAKCPLHQRDLGHHAIGIPTGAARAAG